MQPNVPLSPRVTPESTNKSQQSRIPLITSLSTNQTTIQDSLSRQGLDPRYRRKSLSPIRYRLFLSSFSRGGATNIDLGMQGRMGGP